MTDGGWLPPTPPTLLAPSGELPLQLEGVLHTHRCILRNICCCSNAFLTGMTPKGGPSGDVLSCRANASMRVWSWALSLGAFLRAVLSCSHGDYGFYFTHSQHVWRGQSLAFRLRVRRHMHIGCHIAPRRFQKRRLLVFFRVLD
jgi:hypothetical protein